jgi:hypothetical protein
MRGDDPSDRLDRLSFTILKRHIFQSFDAFGYNLGITQ